MSFFRQVYFTIANIKVIDVLLMLYGQSETTLLAA